MLSKLKILNMHTDSKKHNIHTNANNMLETKISLIQAKKAAMIEGKKIRHYFFNEDETFKNTTGVERSIRKLEYI